MTVYLRGYTYLFASSGEKQAAPYFRRLRKGYIRAVLQDLHDVLHHVYAFLDNPPGNRFTIVRYHDHVRSQVRPGALFESDAFTVALFLQHFDLLHELDEFRVLFHTEVLYYEQSFTPHILEIIYRHYLKYLCERGLRENNPVRLTPALIRKCGLTKADAKIVGKQIDQFNRRVLAEIQLEYDALANLDCIKNEHYEQTK